MKLPILVNLPHELEQLRLRLTELFKDTNNEVNRQGTRTDIVDDVIVDKATKGLVLRDTQATPHYWRVTVSNAGALVITDLGTVKP